VSWGPYSGSWTLLYLSDAFKTAIAELAAKIAINLLRRAGWGLIVWYQVDV